MKLEMVRDFLFSNVLRYRGSKLGLSICSRSFSSRRRGGEEGFDGRFAGSREWNGRGNRGRGRGRGNFGERGGDKYRLVGRGREDSGGRFGREKKFDGHSDSGGGRRGRMFNEGSRGRKAFDRFRFSEEEDSDDDYFRKARRDTALDRIKEYCENTDADDFSEESEEEFDEGFSKKSDFGNKNNSKSEEDPDFFDSEEDEENEISDTNEESLKRGGLRNRTAKDSDSEKDDEREQSRDRLTSKSLIDDERELDELIDKEMASGFQFPDDFEDFSDRIGSRSRSSVGRQGNYRGRRSERRSFRNSSSEDMDEEHYSNSSFGKRTSRNFSSDEIDRVNHSSERFGRRGSRIPLSEDEERMEFANRLPSFSAKNGKRNSQRSGLDRRRRFMSFSASFLKD